MVNHRDENPFSLFSYAEASTLDSLQAAWVGRERELNALLSHFQRARPQHAAIIGQRGAGKTSLALMFREQSKLRNLFPGGWDQIRATSFSEIGPESFEDSLRRTRRRERSLLFIDEHPFGSNAFRAALWTYLEDNRNQDLLICCGFEAPKEMRDPLVVQLGNLTSTEIFALLRSRLMLAGANEAQAQKLFGLVAGNSFYGDLEGKTIREHLLALSEFSERLNVFSRSGIFDPRGRPLEEVPEPVKLVIVDTNRILLERIRSNPEDVYSLDSRKFEELVADILSERGYEITLTPPSNDGGFDMFAARKDDLGSFLYLVECKRYTPPNKVGVSVVRSLHGVVQQQQANGGIVITSSFFTKGAREFQENSPYQMQLRDYLSLQEWLGVPKPPKL